MDIFKIGLLTIQHGRMLLCRKRSGTDLLILPGGKIDPGETHLSCLERELREELGNVEMRGVEYIGSYADRAAGETHRIVHIELYRAELDGTPAAQAEIAELIWFGAEDDRARLSPTLANRIVPDLIARGILPWGGRSN